ncbi:MAG: hypothetical protein WAW75_00570 [Gallionella sp.]
MDEQERKSAIKHTFNTIAAGTIAARSDTLRTVLIIWRMCWI